MITIKDIAREAGVSVTTVSRALNGYNDVNDDTRKKIQLIANELGYSPNMAARSLISKKTQTLGLLLSGITRNSTKDNIAFEILCGMNDRAGELNYDLILFSTTSQKQAAKSYKALCQERGVDGVIIMGIRLDDIYLKEIVSSSLPCVLIDIPFKSNNVGYVTTDNILGASRMTQFLIDQGHKKVAFVNGHAQADVSVKRLEGYRQALERADIPFEEELVLDGGFSDEGARDATYRLMSQRPDVTAIFCASDLMALGTMQALRGLGLTIPEDVSVAGFDNINISAYCSPALTTISQNPYEIGYQSAQMMIDMLEGRQVSKQLVLPTELLIRSSVAAPKIDQS